MKKSVKNTDTPLVTVIMNCHNGQEFLDESLKSLLEQSYNNWELIFWDNCSTDNSKKILQSFSDDRIKYFKSDKFTSLYEARNNAVEKANGKYVGFLDTDDLWESSKIEKQLNYLKKNSEYKVLFSNYYILENKKKKQYLKHKILLPSGNITQRLLDYYSIGILTVFLETDILRKFKFKNNYNIIGDFDFFIDISQKFKIGSIQEPLAIYRTHQSNLSLKKIDIFIKELDEWIKTNEKKLFNLNFSLKQQKIYLIKLKIESLISKFFRF